VYPLRPSRRCHRSWLREHHPNASISAKRRTLAGKRLDELESLEELSVERSCGDISALALCQNSTEAVLVPVSRMLKAPGYGIGHRSERIWREWKNRAYVDLAENKRILPRWSLWTVQKVGVPNRRQQLCVDVQQPLRFRNPFVLELSFQRLEIRPRGWEIEPRAYPLDFLRQCMAGMRWKSIKGYGIRLLNYNLPVVSSDRATKGTGGEGLLPARELR
jgi:hypothetical protein